MTKFTSILLMSVLTGVTWGAQAESTRLIVRFTDPQVHQALTTSAANQRFLANNGQVNLGQARHSAHYGEQALQRVAQLSGGVASHVRSSIMGFDLINIEAGIPVDELLKTLQASGQFESVIVDTPVYTAQFNDPRAREGYQNYLGTYSANNRSGSDFVTMNQQLTNNLGRKIRVAVIDTGYWPHEDVVMEQGYDFVSEDKDGQPGRDANPLDEVVTGTDSAGKPQYCRDGHGLHVSSIVAATTNNSLGIAGAVNDQFVTLLAVRALSCRVGTTSDIVEALYWSAGGEVAGVPALKQPADLINLSLGAANVSCSQYWQDALDFARKKGLIVVAAAGNASIDAADFSPANCQHVISVGALSRNGEMASFSNYGASLDISAEGNAVDGAKLSTESNSEYASFGGTSQAAPLVLAAAAALKLKHPNLTPLQVEDVLKASSMAVPAAPGNTGTSCVRKGCGGLLNAAKALAAVDQQGVSAFEVSYVAGQLSADSAADKAYLQALNKYADACKLLKYQWSGLGSSFTDIRYKIYLTDSSGQSTLLQETATPEFVYPTPVNAVLSAQICRKGQCETAFNMNHSGISQPAICR